MAEYCEARKRAQPTNSTDHGNDIIYAQYKLRVLLLGTAHEPLLATTRTQTDSDAARACQASSGSAWRQLAG